MVERKADTTGPVDVLPDTVEVRGSRFSILGGALPQRLGCSSYGAAETFLNSFLSTIVATQKACGTVSDREVIILSFLGRDGHILWGVYQRVFENTCTGQVNIVLE